MIKDKIVKIIPSCCDIGFISINDCSIYDRNLLKEFLPCANTIIVLAHHVKSSIEWAWFPFESERNNNTCGADLHAKSVLEKIDFSLKEGGYANYIVAYPGRSGIRMKDFANKTNLGSVGDNYLFLHSKWGAWTHLRLLLTDAVITDDKESKHEICIHCGKCLSACPAKAIKDDSFDGVACGNYQNSAGNGIKDDYYWKCEVCARICPVGQSPLKLKITTFEE